MEDETTEAIPSGWTGSVPYRLWRANQVVNRHVAAAVEDLGVTVTQIGITVHLDELGFMSATDLARLFRLTPQSVTTALNQLERMGWVERRPHPSHRKVVWYEATELGRNAADEGRQRVAAVSAEVAALVPAEALETLLTSLDLITSRYDAGGDTIVVPRILPAARRNERSA